MTKGPLIFAVLFCVAALALTAVFWPFINELRDPVYREAFSAWVRSIGWLGVAVLLGLEVLQVIVAVIPGGPVEVIAGAAYGAIAGTGVCVAGCTAASAVVFAVAKRFGRPLLARFFGEKNVSHWKFLSFLADAKKTARIVFIVFLIPGMPKDMLTWFAPLSGLSMPLFLAVSITARVPAILCSAIMGDSVIQGNWTLFAAVFAVSALCGAMGFIFGDRIRMYLKK